MSAAVQQSPSKDRVKASEARQILVGMLMIAALMALLAVAYANQFIDEYVNLGGRYRLVAVFNRVDGLAVGSDVTLSGVKIGTIESMRLDDKYQAWVTLQIDDDIPLPADTSAAIHTDGLLGGKTLVLEAGGDEEVLTDGSRISYTQDSVVVGELLDLIIGEGRAQRPEATGKGDDAAQPH